MEYDFLTTSQQLTELCSELANAAWVGFDTEFVAEDSYRPELCLIQVAWDDRLAVIDPLEIGDVTPFWKTLSEGSRETVVHSGREEFLFCVRSAGKRPVGWFDIQIAAGLVGLEYPAAYSSLVSRLIDKTLSKHETRTDWRKRPLSTRQLEYALEDVIHLAPIQGILKERLEKHSRREWLEGELEAWQANLEDSETRENWRRVSGINSLSPRGLAIVRELWRWRDAEAAARDRPPRRVLRDDLIVELARRQTADMRRIRAVRGLEHRHLRNRLKELSEAIEKALALPKHECPRPPARSNRPQLNLVGQFLTTALGGICREAELATALVGTAQDVRDLIGYRLGITTSDEPPVLASGWRAEIVGTAIDDLLNGKKAVVIKDPLSDQPLTFIATDHDD